jgi:hypothetical protein
MMLWSQAREGGTAGSHQGTSGSHTYRAGLDTSEPAATVSEQEVEACSRTNVINALTKVPGISAGVTSRNEQTGFNAEVNFANCRC